MNDYATIYLVRHGETEGNVKGILQDVYDTDLTHRGITEVKQLAGELKNIEFAAVYSSDIARAIRTAELVRLERGLEVQTTALLRERRLGEFDGMSTESPMFKSFMVKFKELSSFREKWNYHFEGKMERHSESGVRMAKILREISLAHLGNNVLVVSHGNSIRSFLTLLDSKYFEYRVKNSACIKLRCDGVEFWIEDIKGVEPRKHR